MARTRESVPHAMGIPDDVREDLIRRLSRIRGQVNGVTRMVEEDRYCPDVLQQFAAVRSALRSAEKIMLGSHLEGCATRALSEGGEGAEQVREEILELFSRYLK